MKLGNLIQASKSARMYVNEKGKSKKSSSGSGASRDPNATKVKSIVPGNNTGPEGQFQPSQVDLETIEKAYNTEAYIRRAVDKVSGLMFKSGWELTSKNSAALEYVETRLKLIEESTDKSFEELLRETGANYVLYSNAPIIKTRGSENLAGLNATGYYGGEPISGLFPAPPTLFEIQQDAVGNIEAYKVASSSGGDDLELKPEDVSHLSYHKPTGRPFGIPYIQNVLDDVLILRQIEENVARLVYKNLFPLQTYTVGTTKDGYESTDAEIDEVSNEIEGMSLDGMIVLPERHKIETVSSNNSMLDANDYLKYFRQRVFTGLGMSESTMGIGDTANRSTSDNQSSDLNDLVKDFQQSYSEAIQRGIINEILFEGGFDPTLNRDDEVDFKFIEIETSEKIKRDNHTIQLWLNNLITFEEARKDLGKDPTADTSTLYSNFSSKGESEDNGGQSENQNQPENQHGKKDGPKKESLFKNGLTESSKAGNFNIDNSIKEVLRDLNSDMNILKEDISNRINKNQSFENIYPFTTKLMETRFNTKIKNISLNIITERNREHLKVKNHIERQAEITAKTLIREIEFKLSESDMNIEEVFNSMSYKIKSIVKTETYKGVNYQECLSKISKNEKKAKVISKNELCNKCSSYDIMLDENKWYKNVPPHHTNCECLID